MYTNYSNELSHYGILGMKWGVRRYQNADGSLTSAGKARYGSSSSSGANLSYNKLKIASNVTFRIGQAISYGTKVHAIMSPSVKSLGIAVVGEVAGRTLMSLGIIGDDLASGTLSKNVLGE